MKKHNIYDAISGIDEKYLERAEDFKEISAQFKRSKIHMAEKYVSLAACLAFTVIIGLNIYDKNDIVQQSSMISPSYQNEYNETQPVTYTSINTEGITEQVTEVITDITENTAVTALKTDTYQTSAKPTENSAGYVQTNAVTAAADKTTSISPPASEKPVTAGTKVTFKTTVRPATNNSPQTTAATVSENEQTVSIQTTVIDVGIDSPQETLPQENDSIPGSVGAAPGAASPGIKVPDKWENMHIFQKFDHVVWENTGYMIYGKIRGNDGVGEKLGDITAVGYDSAKGETHYIDAEVFRIDNTDNNMYIAVRFNGFKEFYMYRSIIYF